ncbi:MAG: T9SS type A sorting domain-containing protein [Candidatus Cloacimonetes bacterium]|nr:T9SS type A sorting domain-containing protein [Candidatus Cloacimonadota bacterium]MBS3766715.1 T9SS type A sorting domain-containing protein [Candidatus Cloacimonadota bacterium]
MQKRFIIITLLIIFAFSTLINAKELKFSFKFKQPNISQNQINSELSRKISKPGNPVIPYFSSKILIPFGHKIKNIEVENSQWQILTENQMINWAQKPYPISHKIVRTTPKNESIYSSINPYPGKNYELSGKYYMAGHKIAVIKIYPYKYIPQKGIVKFSQDWQVNIATEYSKSIANYQSKFLNNSPKMHNEISGLVKNTSLLNSYQNQESHDILNKGIVTPNDPHDYIIITSQDFVSTFNPFLDWKNEFDLNAKIYTTSEIYSNYSGEDSQAKIRNFIIDAYTVWSATDTPLEYVLLGGDDEIIPDRKLYVEVGSTVGNIPADFYYSELDSDWDSNGNGLYGEHPGDNVDFIPEIAIGRISADTETGFNNAFAKIMSYTETPQPALEKACMVGENLNWNPVTWGGDYKDDVSIRFPENNYHISTLYQRDGTYSGQNVFNAINSGCGILNHMGHSNYNILMGMSPATPDQFTNSGYGLIYSQGCLPAAFDEQTSHSGECIAERLQIAEAGPMAFVGNTRYGWYSPGSIEGPSQQFDRTFFDGLFSEDIRNLGKCNNYSRVQLLDTVDEPVMRWCYYELTLLGDPHAEILSLDGAYPMLEPADIVYNDDLGDGDGSINPGETIQMFVNVKNIEDWQTANDVVVTMQNSNTDITVIDSISHYGTINPGQQVSPVNDPITFEVSPSSGYENIEYKLKITANPDSIYSFTKTFTKTLSVNLEQTNWPVYIGSEVKCSPLVIDLDNDGAKEIIVNDAAGNIYSVSDAGNTETNFPVSLDEGIWGSIAVGDINNDEELEIVANTIGGKIIAINSQGNILFEYPTSEQIIATPTLYDLDNNETLEIITPTTNGNIFVLDHAGETFGAFPYNVGEGICTEVALGDINNDMVPDVVFGTITGLVFAIDAQTNILDGFPYETDAKISASPIIFAENRIAFSNNNNKLFSIDGSGSLLFEKDYEAKIPISLLAFQNESDDYRMAFNINNGFLGLVGISGDYLTGWPQNLNFTPKNSPIAADLDSDNSIEIITITSNGTIFSFNQSGEITPYFPIETNYNIQSPLTIADIDSDGDFEILAGSSTSLVAWDYKETKGTKTPWAMFKGNPHRTGNLADSQNNTIDDPQNNPYSTKLFQNFPNPFKTDTKFLFSLRSGNLSETKINIYNVRGQLIKSLNGSAANTQNDNNYSLTWDGTNQNGINVSSGIYFYKLLTQNFTSEVKRLILIK